VVGGVSKNAVLLKNSPPVCAALAQSVFGAGAKRRRGKGMFRGEPFSSWLKKSRKGGRREEKRETC